MDKSYFIYIMTNSRRTVLYIGVTNNLKRRVWEHREKLGEGFTKRYNLTQLVYCELAECPITAIEREKQLKAGSRRNKEALIRSVNPDWKDLYETL